MPKFTIEREIPGAGKFTATDLKALSQKSCGVLSSMGSGVQWIQSCVSDDKRYCIYQAPEEAALRQHAEPGEFPANSISRVHTIIYPATAG